MTSHYNIYTLFSEPAMGILKRNRVRIVIFVNQALQVRCTLRKNNYIKNICILQVTPPKSNASMDLFELLVKNTSAFEDYLLSMESHKAWQLMTAMLLTTEAQELVDGSNSEKSLQQRIAVSV